MVGSDAGLAAWTDLFPDQPFLLQEVVAGVPASVSCIADGRRAVAVATNRQLLRGGGEMGYGFAGSVTPCDHPLAGEMAAIAEEIAGASGCVGTVGVDFVLPDEGGPVAIELNPRFQGTLETVEAATGENLVRLHLDACDGRLPRCPAGAPPVRGPADPLRRPGPRGRDRPLAPRPGRGRHPAPRHGDPGRRRGRLGPGRRPDRTRRPCTPG